MNYLKLLLIAFVLAGCATKKQIVEYPVSPNMATAYGSGQMFILWNSQLNQTYTVYYTDAPKGKLPDWKALPQATRLPGTGKQITISDKVASEKQRRYLLMVGDEKPY